MAISERVDMRLLIGIASDDQLKALVSEALKLDDGFTLGPLCSLWALCEKRGIEGILEVRLEVYKEAARRFVK